MKQILIGKGSTLAYAAKVGGGTIASATEIDVLDAGALAVLTQEGVLVTGNAAAIQAILNDMTHLIFAVGNPNGGGTIVSQPIERRYAKVEKYAYVAPVKQVLVIGNDGTSGSLGMPATVAVGDIVGIKVVNVSKGTQPPVKTEYIEYRCTASDTNLTAITNLIAKINSKSTLVAATVVGSQVGITLTCKDFGVTVECSVYGLIENSTQNTTTSPAVRPNFGQGTPALISDMEFISETEAGNTNKLWESQNWFKRASLVDNAATYDVYVIMYDVFKTEATNKQRAGYYRLVVALPASSTQATTFELVLTNAFGAAYTIGSAGGAESGL